MPSIQHDAVVHLLRSNLWLAVYLLASTGYPIPAGTPALTDSSLPTKKPRERRADVVTLVENGKNRLAIVCEVQTSRPSRRKRRRWLGYIANAEDHYDCGAVLLVITPGNTPPPAKADAAARGGRARRAGGTERQLRPHQPSDTRVRPAHNRNR
jgi:hypothetical protein